MKVYDDGSRRGEDDGYSCGLVPGLRSSEDARRLASEIAFSSGRLLGLAAQPPGLYGQARALAQQGDVEAATWVCLLCAYLSPVEGNEPFGGIEEVLVSVPDVEAVEHADPQALEVALGARSAHQSANGIGMLVAYRRWVQNAGSQHRALLGDESWSPERRFERIFERLALPGLARWARYELLVVLARLGVYEMRASALAFVATNARQGASAAGTQDSALIAAKRVFGIGDPLLLQRRGLELAGECGVPVESLDLALCNWGAPVGASMGTPLGSSDDDALLRARSALGID